MKKIILLICCLFLTGCYDYQELNNRAIISGAAIDYQNQNFNVTLEVLNNKKSSGSSKEDTSDKTYYIEGTGKSISEAFLDCNSKISKDPYYAHLKVLVIGEEVAKEKMEQIFDYFIREPSIRNIFLPVVASGNSAKDIIMTTSKENPVASQAIQTMIENNKTANSVNVQKDYEKFLDEILDKYIDSYLNTVTKNENNIYINGIASFKDNHYAFSFNEKEATTFNAMANNSKNYYINILDEDENLTINVYDSKTSIEFKDNKITINGDLKATVIEDNKNYALRNPESYEKLNEIFTKEIQKQYSNIIEKLKNTQTDMLGIKKIYYQKTRENLNDWYSYPIETKINLNINKNGNVFEVTNNE